MSTTIQHTVSINRQVSDVYRFVTDFSNHSRWQPAGVQLERAGQVKIGDMVVGTRRLAWRRVQVNADVIDIVPNQKLVYSGVMGGFAFRTTYNFKFAAGGSELTEITEIRVQWWFFFLRPLDVSSLRGQITAALEKLKQVMEARADLAAR